MMSFKEKLYSFAFCNTDSVELHVFGYAQSHALYRVSCIRSTCSGKVNSDVTVQLILSCISLFLEYNLCEILAKWILCSLYLEVPTKIYRPQKFWRHWSKAAAVEATFVDVLVYVTKPGNSYDQYAVAVGKNGIVKNHLLRKRFHVFVLLKKGGRTDHCRVIGRQRYSVDLLQARSRVELRYSGIFRWFNFRGWIQSQRLNSHKNFYVYRGVLKWFYHHKK